MKSMAGNSDRKKLNAIALDRIDNEFFFISALKNSYTSNTATPSSPGSVNVRSLVSQISRWGFSANRCSQYFFITAQI